jgi:hypothetical protein
MSSFDEQREKIRMARELDTKTFIEEMKEQVQQCTEQQALAALHKARFWFARNGFLKVDLAFDSRRWLIANGYDLPETGDKNGKR